MKLQIASDIHLEFYDDPKLRDFIDATDADVLLLCGDIGPPYLGSYDKFLAECSQAYSHVVIIAGNHEYYQFKNPDKWTIERTDMEINNIVAKYTNVTYLNNSSYKLNDEYIILGTILWTNIPKHMHIEAQMSMNDYRYIYTESSKAIPSITSSLHDTNIKWLRKELEQNSDRKIIIMTHHLPSYKMINKKFKDYPLNCCFANADDDVLSGSNVKFCFSGHSHSNTDVVINDCRCIINPHGYRGENPGFIKNLVISL